MPPQVKSKENASSSEKEIPTRATGAVREMPGRRGNFGPKPMDLQSLLITLLKENPKGMSLKALEKAVGDTIPNSARKIETIVKKIATFQAPGRYFLKPGVELDSLKKPSSESGSSPEDNHHQTPAPEENHDQTPAPVASIVEKVSEMEEQNHLDSKLGVESNVLEQIDIQQHSPDLGGDRKASDNSEGQANSASDSGSDSDSDSDSSDSGSDSGSRSRSRSRSGSPAGSGSGSSSDSESDASSNSKEGSDEDVDIMTSDDYKETKQDLQASEPGVVQSPIPWQTEHDRPLQNGMDENQDGDGSDAVDIEGNGSDAVDVEGHGSDGVDIEKDLPEDEQQIGMAVSTRKEGEKPEEGAKPSSSDCDELQERQNFIGNLFDDAENLVKDSVRHEQSDNSERLPKAKSKRGSDLKHIDEKSERTKRSKSESLSQPHVSGSRDPNFFGSIRNFSPNRPIDDPYQSSSVQMMNKGDREEHADFGSQKGYNQVFPRKSSSDFHQSGRRPSDQGAWAKATIAAERPMKHTESSGHGRKFSEKSVHEGHFIQKDNPSRDTQNEDGLMKDKKLPRNTKEGGAGGKNAVPSDFHHRKLGETVGKFKDAGQISSSYINSPPKDNSRVTADRYPVNGKSNMLQRELSHLELGEIREPLVEETPIKKQFERKSSFKQSGSGPSTSENFNPDLSRGKSVGKTNWDSGKPSPPNLSGLRRTPEYHVEDLTRSHLRVVQSQPQHLSRVDRPEVGSHSNKLADTSSKTRQNETGAKLGVDLEGYGESHKKAPASASQPQESKRGSVSQVIKDSKTLASNKMVDVTDGRKDTVLAEGNVNGRRKRGSSSDEECCPYSKYEKDEPEYRGPIKDSSQ
ncbi:Dentin sialophosphoprotein-related, putative isoform 6 [Theobroma cacao]|nr:Dentin sialophosphoprotein-related, putative isoform 6 [Theobroma cacao]